MFKLGIQIYSVRDEYAQNPLSCFRQMKQCGYDGAELFGSIKTHPAEQLKAITHRLRKFARTSTPSSRTTALWAIGSSSCPRPPARCRRPRNGSPSRAS